MFYLGLLVGLGLGRALVGLAAGRDGFPQAPHALKLLFIFLIFMGFRKYIVIDCR
mgnify:FL=1